MASGVQFQGNERYLQHQLQQARNRHDRKAECFVLVQLAMYSDRQQDYPRACNLFEELLPLAREIEEKDYEKLALFGHANTLVHMQRYHSSIPVWQEVIRLGHELSDPETEIEGISNLGFAYVQAELPQEALPFLREAIERTRHMSEKQALPNMLNNLGIALSKLGQHQEAIATYRQALLIAREWGKKGDEAFHLGNIGHEYFDHLHQPDQALSYFSQALLLFHELQDAHYEAQTLYNLGRAHWAVGNVTQAQEHLLQARDDARQLRDDMLLARALTTLSEIAAELGQVDAAVRYYDQGHRVEDPPAALHRHQEQRQHAQDRGDTRSEAYHLGEIATALGKLSRQEEALSTNLETINLYRRLGDQHGEAICLINIGTLCCLVDQQAQCLACWRRGYELIMSEHSPEKEMVRQKLDSLEPLWGRATFQRAQKECVALFEQLKMEPSQLRVVFAPTLALLQKEDRFHTFLEEWAEPVDAGASRSETSPSEQIYRFLTGLSSEPQISLKGEARNIDQDRDRSLRLGKRALHRKRFDLAEKHFRKAVQFDMLDESEACYYLALTRLWQRDFGEAHYLFDVDQQDRGEDAPLSWFLAEWCAICAASSPSDYLAVIRDDMDDSEDSLAYKEELFSFNYGDYPDDLFHDLVAAMFAYIKGEFEECLQVLEECEADEQEIPTWVVPFWKSMASLALGLNADALKWLRQALTAEIPPLLLLPLRWHEHDPSDVFEQDIRPLFDNFDLWSQVIELNEREQKKRKERQERVQWWMEQGAIAYTEHRFTQAEEFFYLAFQERLFAKEDVGDLAIARFWYALACLQGGEFGGLERVLLEDGKKDTVCQNIGVLPTLLGEWYRMCHYETQSAYLASLPHGLNLQGHFRELLAGVPEGPGGQVLRAVATCVDGHPGQSLKALLSIQTDNKIDPPWLATFWLGMAETFTDHATQAQETVRLAVTQGMPEVFLLPIWWCRENAPDTFAETLQPLLDTHHLPSPQEFWG